MKQAIIITGAAGGLGKAIVDTCLSAFPELLIVATDISPDIESIPDNDHILGMKVDVTHEDSIIALRKALEEMGVRVWAIVNNAGVSDFFPVSEKEKDALEKMFAINTFGAVNMVRAFLPHMMETKGRVVNISSESVRLPAAFHPYAASKIALEALSVSMRNELGLQGIKLSIIRPGAINTMLLDDLYNMKERIGESIYKEYLLNFATKAPGEIRKISKPADVAAVVVKALTSSKPKRYYRVNNNPKLRVAALLPHRVRDYFMKKMLESS
ncbi:MAG: SDR family NAD(P)-dependent oxidoreductase [Bacteroidales bacterium]|nr:SDR family NAD(P)-dependent oxidoreductase [Bacteroidales bacterium]